MATGDKKPKNEEVLSAADERLIEKSKKAQEELQRIRERQAKYTEAEMQARQVREEAGQEVAVAGAKVLEAVDTAQVAARRLEDEASRGTGARIDAVRAATNVEIAESDFIRTEREYQEQQVRVSKLFFTSELLDLKADIKELEAINLEIDIVKSQLRALERKYVQLRSADNLTAEQQTELETLEASIAYLRSKISRLEVGLKFRVQDVRKRESQLSLEILAALEQEIADEEVEYLQYADAARAARVGVGQSIVAARQQEAQFAKALKQELGDADGVLNKNTDSRLINTLKQAQQVKVEVLNTGVEVLDKRIADAEANIEAGIRKGLDVTAYKQLLAALIEQKAKAEAVTAAAQAVEKAAQEGFISAERFKVVGDASGEAVAKAAERAGTQADIAADASLLIPYAGIATHTGLHIAAGVARAAGHTLAGLEKVKGETLRGESRISIDGAAAEARMEAEASQLGISNTGGLSQAAGQRHGEVERTITFDRVGQIMSDTGKQVTDDILQALHKAGIHVTGLDGIVGVNGLGNYFLQGLDEQGIFDAFGDYGFGVRAALGAFLGGDDAARVLDALGTGTVYRAAAEGFIGGISSELAKAGLISSQTTEGFLNALNASRNVSKVQSDYFTHSSDEQLVDNFRELGEASRPYSYSHWFDQSGDREEARRIAAQAPLPIRQAFLKDSKEIDDSIAGDSEDFDGDADEDAMEDSEASYDEDSEDSEDAEVGGVRGWLRSPYGSLLRKSVSTLSTVTPQGVLKGLTKAKGTAAYKQIQKKIKKRKRIFILCVIVAAVLIFAVLTMAIVQPLVLGILDYVTSHQNRRWDEDTCTCGCLEQFYGLSGDVSLPAGLQPGDAIDVLIWNAFVQANVPGLSERPEVIAGIMGNIVAESGTCPFKEEATTAVNKGLGIVQWTGGRRTNVENFMYLNGVDQSKFEAEIHTTSKKCAHDAAFMRTVTMVQVNYIVWELQNTWKDYLKYLDTVTNKTGEAGARAYAELFCAAFERPTTGTAADAIQDDGVRAYVAKIGGTSTYSGLNRRRNTAAEYYQKFGTNGGVPASSVAQAPVTSETTEQADNQVLSAPDAQTDAAASTESPATAVAITSATTEIQGPHIVCDCPVDCMCFTIHGFENVYRSNGTAVSGRSGVGFNLAVDKIIAKGGYIVHEDVIPGGVVLYLQKDTGTDNPAATWAELPYDGANIGDNGCGPATLAIIVSTLCPDKIVNPADTALVATSKGWDSGTKQGSKHSIMWEGPAYYGLKSEAVLSNEDSYKAVYKTDDGEWYAKESYKEIMDEAKVKLIDALASNKLVFGVFGHTQFEYGAYSYTPHANVFTTGGHFLAIVGISPDHTKVYISDPANRARTEKEWDIDQVLANVTRGLYAISK